MQTKSIALLLICALFSITACKNESKKTAQVSPPKAVANTTLQNQNGSMIEEADLSSCQNSFLHRATQRFTIPARQSVTITGSKGLKVDVDPNVLVHVDGSPVNSAIQVSLIELTNSDELFKASAATVSDGRMLASGGSYYVEMRSGGKMLKVKKGSTLNMTFPKLYPGEMELFYGERNSEGTMNWKQAGTTLEKNFMTVSYKDAPAVDYNLPQYKVNRNANTWYDSIKAPVYFNDQRMTLGAMVKLLIQNGKDVCLDSQLIIDSYYMTSGHEPRKVKDSHWTYRIMTGADYREQEEYVRKLKEAQERIRLAEQQRLNAKVETYYVPVPIPNLGWLNCDRFYNNEQINVEVQPVFAMKDSRIHYFAIFREINSMLNGSVITGSDQKMFLERLPVGQKITLVAFTKFNGKLFQTQQDITIAKNQKISLNFKPVSNEEINKMYGSNVKI